jgi:hypothetical protein
MAPLGAPGASSPSPAETGLVTPPYSSASNAVSSLHINAAVSQLLQGIGGGAENNKTLQMLIALLILVALLDSSQQPTASAGSLDALASGIGQGGYSGFSMSSTTITIEQSSMIYRSSGAESLGAAENPAAPGSRLDLVG